MRVGIVGAGIFGVATALELSSRGHDVTMYDRGAVPNPEASSTDVSKAIRRTGYPEETYIELVLKAAHQWRLWHDRLSGSIYYHTGKLSILDGVEADSAAHQGRETLEKMGIHLPDLDVDEARKRFPQFTFRDSDIVFVDPWAGYLRSGQAVADLAGLARSEGVQIIEETEVLALEESGSGVVLRTAADSHLEYDRVIVAAGAWIVRLLPQLARGLRITKQQMAFFKPADSRSFEQERFPVWTVLSEDAAWYGFPYLREGFVKVAEDNKLLDADPDVDREPTADFLEQASQFVAERIPQLAAAPRIGGRSCLYTNTPDEHFVVDWAPDSQRIMIAGCGSGHGFKFGGSIGPVVADALEEKENHHGDLFRIGDRFRSAKSLPPTQN